MKIRRTAAVTVTAAALALLPSAAFGYGAADYTNTGTASTTTPTVGTPFTITVQGPANTPVIITVTTNPASIPDAAITIAGTKALTKTTSASGAVAFSVTLAEPGTYTAIITDGVSGEALSTQVFVVPGPAAGGTGSAPGAGGSSGGWLSQTGSDPVPIALGAGALLAAGAGAAVYARQRRRAAGGV
ncbi:hypothetical protein [Cellulomonas sp. B6]|uniref:hypothetical protein n=1 Tax=Cellulomonas sp. B6 TaxID=1295626 RepID=UPI00073B8602|nr:hypothetical protein [Cellulomonas sp. B6]KSW28900.1 hypothetical protein ATM99_10540 [Cellulomonas sp. B6]